MGQGGSRRDRFIQQQQRHHGVFADLHGSAQARAVGRRRRGCAATTATTAAAAAAGACLYSSRHGAGHLSPGGGGGAHHASHTGQGLEAVLAGQYGHMAKTATAGTSPPKQFINVLTLALAGQFHQAEFSELGNLWPGGIVGQGLGEVLQ